MSFTLILLYIICTFIRPQEWIPMFFSLPMINILAFATTGSLILEWMGRGRISLIHVPQNLLMLGLLGSMMMSHVVHTYLGGLIGVFKGELSFLPMFILFFITLNAMNTERKLKIVIWLMVILIVILVFQGMYQLNHGYGWAGQDITYDYYRDIYRINWIGIFNDPNDLALTFVIAVGILIAFLLGKSSVFTKLMAVPGLGLLFYGIFLTNSRGGLLALMTTLYFYFIKRTNRLFWGSIIGGLVGFATFTFGPSRKAMFNIEEESAFNRIQLWYEGIKMMKSNPLFGVGFRMYTADLPQTAHNSFILAGAELGFVGLFFWTGLIYISYKGLALVQESGVSYLKNYALGLQCGLIGFCAAAFFLSRTYIVLPYLLFALSGAMVHAARAKNPNIKFEFGKREIKVTFWLSLASLLLAYLFIKIAL